MSFQRKALNLTWPEGHDLHGLEVLCRRPTVEQVEVAEAGLGRDRDGATVAQMMRDTIGSALIRWNYVDEDGNPPPATPDGFAKIDIEAQMEILAAWTAKAIAVPAAVGKESGSGQPSRAATSGIPVTGRQGLSDALRSLPMHSEPLESSSASPVTP